MPYKIVDVEVKVWDKLSPGRAKRSFEVETPEGESWSELARRVAEALTLNIKHTEW